jgi:Plavaka transposase
LHRLPLGIVNEEWTKTRYEPITRIQGIHRPLYYCVYRDVVKAIKFLIGHRPFRDALTYAPTRVYNTSNQRVYNELYTADWWWETQARLPDGATVVPVLLATDKTQLTTHHGDKSSWPVYITIGNLDRKTRRKQNLPANLLLGFIPNMKSIDYDTRSACYHKAMEEMLKRKCLIYNK